MNPTVEQQSAIDDVLHGNNVLANACPGAGKTTLIFELAKQLLNRNPRTRILILTYSSLLKTSSRQKVREFGLVGSVRVESFHSLMGVVTDIQLALATERMQGEPDATRVYDYVIVDESQDLTPVYVGVAVTVIRNSLVLGADVRCCLVGDARQLINEYRGAKLHFMQDAPSVFPVQGDWYKHHLTVSFRVPRPVCNFINGVSPTEQPLVPGVDCYFKPEYLVHGKTLGERALFIELQACVADAIRNDKTVFVLAPSVRARPRKLVYSTQTRVAMDDGSIHDVTATPGLQMVTRFANFLVRNNMSTHVYVPSSDDSSSVDERVLGNKVVFSTFHGTKGLEADLVIVFGFDDSYFRYYARDENPDVMPNTHYVAMTRTKGRLILCHDARNAYLPYLPQDKLDDVSTRVTDIVPNKPKAPDASSSSSDSERTHYINSYSDAFSLDMLRNVLQLISATVTEPDTDTLDMQTLKFNAGTDTYENVGTIIDVCIPMYYEYLFNKRHGLPQRHHGQSLVHVLETLYQKKVHPRSIGHRWKEAWTVVNKYDRNKLSIRHDMKINLETACRVAAVVTSHSYLNGVRQLKRYDNIISEREWNVLQRRLDALELVPNETDFDTCVQFPIGGNMLVTRVDIVDHAHERLVDLDTSVSEDTVLRMGVLALMYKGLTGRRYTSCILNPFSGKLTSVSLTPDFEEFMANAPVSLK